MWFREVAVNECVEGYVLAHSRRVRGARLAKGTALTAAHLQQLTDAGVERIHVAVLTSDDVDEDQAADRLARAAAGVGVSLSRALTGRCNLHADVRGLLIVDEARLRAVNHTSWRLTLATVPQHTLVEPGDQVATIKVIPFAVDGQELETTEALAAEPAPLLAVARLRPHSAALVLSELDDQPPPRQGRTIAAQRSRLGALGSTLDRVEHCAHTVTDIAAAVERCVDAGHNPVLFIGASAVVDPRDVFPAALRTLGGQVDHIGMPVDPGNLMVIGAHRNCAVLGVPGCARTNRVSGFDRVLRAYLAGVPLSSNDLRDLGLGGLLETSNSGTAPRPRRPSDTQGVAAVVLAAGLSSRMGGVAKVLRRGTPGGPPVVRQVVDRLEASGVSPIVVVTGHQAAGVRQALAGTRARMVHNPQYRVGMGSSLATGASAVDDIDSALIVLGDMPNLQVSVVKRLVAEWRSGRHPIVAPVFRGRRGHPVLFDAAHLNALRQCSGDVGARQILAKHPVHLVPVDDAGVVFDIDTPADLWRWQSTEGRHD